MKRALLAFIQAWRQQAAIRAYHRSARRTARLDSKLVRAVARESAAAERMENSFGASHGGVA